MQQPNISIIMPAFNSEKYIEEAIESVLSQSFRNWELIIINDASTDKTHELIRKYKKKDKRIVYIKNRKNSGLVMNLIKGLRLSKGGYIARIDSDDIWTDKDKLKKQFNFLRDNPGYGLVGCWAKVVDVKSNELFSLCYPSKN